MDRFDSIARQRVSVDRSALMRWRAIVSILAIFHTYLVFGTTIRCANVYAAAIIIDRFHSIARRRINADRSAITRWRAIVAILHIDYNV